ncbi:MAG: RNA 2',3'-cyclic phosphodiesterase [Acidobacteria bacterium]|nr:RNA 2',3'-cyclic phosphodiesterase [Acidobacteriota bacterium]NIM62064.1 RNA 2',3'-cyclic phosphodiesterase [Acidobacteriota bacterium]NIO59713.1 RNA 2',3'-cyclic phosphodiesterase [Acidobacteriota bacterium]NIQ30802.1 RNA 2',3'-cyclic phosphodiesterase [Acidobacteriota bacterium]NIQ85864.1 RNA 2',3'-cyclic phosphodiesterase [Acidobacteriota bacterium]
MPDAWREALDAYRARLEGRLAGWRWSRADSIHLTLRFLGEVDADTDNGARRQWKEAVWAHKPFELRPGPPGWFPPRGRPRVLWASVDASRELDRLAESLEQAARRAGFEPETRAFRPHLTLARARRNERAGVPGAGEPPLAAPAVTVSEVVLYQSVLHPAGARYTALERYRLG